MTQEKIEIVTAIALLATDPIYMWWEIRGFIKYRAKAVVIFDRTLIAGLSQREP